MKKYIHKNGKKVHSQIMINVGKKGQPHNLRRKE